MYQKQLSEKYNTEELFKNKKLNKVTNTDVIDLIEYKKHRWCQKY